MLKDKQKYYFINWRTEGSHIDLEEIGRAHV